MVGSPITEMPARCAGCGSQLLPGDRFCGSCGSTTTIGVDRVPATQVQRISPLVPPPQQLPSGQDSPHPAPATAPPTWQPAADSDDTTRYLCAAAHIDPDFAKAAIGEYLVEPTRAIAPTPGVDCAAVLRDAVAARFRGKLRDGLLLGLGATFFMLSGGMAVAWTVSALCVAGIMTLARRGRSAGVIVAIVLLTPLVLAAIVAAVLGSLISQAVSSTSSFDPQTGQIATQPGALSALAPGLGSLALAAVVALLIVIVLVADAAAVDHLVHDRFRLGNFGTDVRRMTGLERFLRTMGVESKREQLHRVELADERGRHDDSLADVVVHRDWRPFVGAGDIARDQTISLPLEPDDDPEDAADPAPAGIDAPEPFTAAELHEHIRASMGTLRSSVSLSPGGRLGRLFAREQVLVPAGKLRGLAGTPVAGIAADPYYPPTNRIPIEIARRLADAPLEPARYYLCFRLEAWDRDLTTSFFVNASTDQKTLYLEWTHCALYPVKDAYRVVDDPRGSARILRALGDAVLLPTTVPRRVANLCHFFRRAATTPARYGAGASLREFGAETKTSYFVQEADAARYMQLVEQELFRCVSEFLDAKGYSVVEVTDLARQKVTNHISIRDSTISNSAVGIGDNRRRTRRPSRG